MTQEKKTANKTSAKHLIGVEAVAEVLFDPIVDFIEQPAFEEIMPLFAAAKEKRYEAAEKKNCSCRVKISEWGVAFFDAFFEILLDARKTNHRLTCEFIDLFISAPDIESTIGKTIVIAYKEHRHEIFIDTSEDT